MIDFGIVRPGTTLYIPFHTFDSNDPSASVTLTGLATSDIEVYKDGSVTQRASDSGFALLDTDGIDFDGITGIHGISIDLADNTTAGFYAAGSQYFVVISSITVDAATINFIAARFTIGYPSAILNTTIATLSSQTSFTLTSGPAEDDALNGMWCVIHDVASGVQMGKALILDYTGSTKTVTLAAGTTFTAAATDNFAVIDLAPLQPTTTGRTLDVSTGGEAGLDWANIGSPTTANNLSATNIDVDQVVASVSGAVGSVTGNVGGNVTGSIGSVATGGITAGSIAADAIGASELAADAVTEIQSGLATAANLATVAGYLDTEIAAILADTNELQTDLVNGGRLDLLIDAIKAKTDNLPSDPADASVVAGLIAGLDAKLDTIDNFLDTEISGLITSVTGIVPVSGTIGATGNSTTALHLDGLAYADDGPNSMLLTIKDVSTGLFYSRWIADFATTGDIATVATLPFTPEASVDLYWITPMRADVSASVAAADIRSALGMASANLDTQLAAIDDLIDTEVAAIKSDTAAILIDTAEIGAAGAGLTALATQASVNTIDDFLDTEVAAIKAVTDQITFGTANRVNAQVYGVETAAITAGAIATDAIGAAELAADAITEIQSGLATAAALTTVDDFLDTEIAAIKAKTDLIPAAPAAVGDIPSAATIADAVWDEDATAHQTQGTFGQAIGDPGADTDTIWALANTNLDAAISSRASQTSLDTLDDYVDSEVAAIKAKTDNLPSDPADASVVAGLIAAVEAKVDIIDTNVDAINIETDAAAIANAVWDSATADQMTAGTFGLALGTTVPGLLDTEVAAIKAKTDNLPADPADASDIAASFVTVNSKLDTIDDFLDTEVAAILADTNELQTDWANGGRLDLILDARASQTSVDDLPTNAELATSQAAADDATLAAIAALDTKIDTIDNFVDTEVAAVKAVTDKLDTALELDGAVYRYTTNALEQAPSGSGLDAAATRAALGLASANLDTQLADLPTNAELTTALGTADDAVLTQVALVKTETDKIASIKTKTDLIPSDPADASDLATLIDAIPTANENADALLKRDWTAVTGEASRSVLNALRFIRNKFSTTVTPGLVTIYEEDDTTVAYTKSLTTDASAEPIVQG